MTWTGAHADGQCFRGGTDIRTAGLPRYDFKLISTVLQVRPEQYTLDEIQRHLLSFEAQLEEEIIALNYEVSHKAAHIACDSSLVSTNCVVTPYGANRGSDNDFRSYGGFPNNGGLHNQFQAFQSPNQYHAFGFQGRHNTISPVVTLSEKFVGACQVATPMTLADSSSVS
ncbi:hypothetical protein FEM48_ZijujUnG0057900 [Ziziphus jujuba var. spinosa]|uniref:Uncharacterized protein n=1 Tax=Ziziphus jujuba var. spinosa TaxID=714518 RepID=A0A978U910_ZIZJJ|nr:hypothetical protein FEM48_ZijujUnG0057900 [Ziziphus jujuba var. spinosa]